MKLDQKTVDEIALKRFTEAMRDKLARSRDKGRDGWHDPDLCPDGRLADMLIGHLPKGNAGNFLDIAALAMMLHERGEDPASLRDAIARNATALQPWRPIEDAVKGGPAIWARLRDDISTMEGRKNLEIWNGVQVPLRHPGTYIDEDGGVQDHGWNVAAAVGHGGFPDRWIDGWIPMRGDPEHHAWVQSDRTRELAPEPEEDESFREAQP
jgi:hypothetical protein